MTDEQIIGRNVEEIIEYARKVVKNKKENDSYLQHIRDLAKQIRELRE